VDKDNNNKINPKDNVYSVLIKAEPLQQLTWFTWWIQHCAKWPPILWLEPQTRL